MNEDIIRLLEEEDYLNEPKALLPRKNFNQVFLQILTFKKEDKYIIDVPVAGTHSARVKWLARQKLLSGHVLFKRTFNSSIYFTM